MVKSVNVNTAAMNLIFVFIFDACRVNVKTHGPRKVGAGCASLHSRLSDKYFLCFECFVGFYGDKVKPGCKP